ncbi:hypothetical protein [Streptomyces spectabilis]|uniref:Uncharacterized protein n=1 Tax=Streptomyces spectabilis TaxID=68270 RepID=A0A5P2X5P2_STRST|nr:hypothetical protein [Streptomyces spectabilis]MBB5108340.1 hypothetical protein [Streptomyces spectabilis]MCI3901097.1 hypothetical protein [Streptomyces spectabilis]QEV58589.1 hypothetical protein CP982_07560 [Streptomyces spectabilis]GGV45948.1 hypothetical protein GCM10010245_72020 [Streptomyces spectabilis]
MTVLFDADHAATELGVKRRSQTSVGEVRDAAVADLFADFAAAREAGRPDMEALVLDHAYALDPLLVDELLGFDYPAAA